MQYCDGKDCLDAIFGSSEYYKVLEFMLCISRKYLILLVYLYIALIHNERHLKALDILLVSAFLVTNLEAVLAQPVGIDFIQ